MLLSLARTTEDRPAQAATVTAYVNALAAEPDLKLRSSMLTNLDFTHLGIPAASAAKLDQARADLLPPHPPYDEWFRGTAKPKLEVRHYVMDEFWTRFRYRF